MISPKALRSPSNLRGSAVRLEPLTQTVLEDYLRGLQDPEVQRLTGTHAAFDRASVEDWLRTRADHDDRADWAILRADDGGFLGEAVLNDHDPDNGSASYRLWLAGPELFGRGYGTAVTRLVVDYAFDELGLHRLALEVHEHNPRARRVYEKCGFTVEGRLREALLWQRRRYDTLLMSMLRTDGRPAE